MGSNPSALTILLVHEKEDIRGNFGFFRQEALPVCIPDRHYNRYQGTSGLDLSQMYWCKSSLPSTFSTWLEMIHITGTLARIVVATKRTLGRKACGSTLQVEQLLVSITMKKLL